MGNNIQAKRLERGISQKEFADALEVDRVTVWRWENNLTTLPEKTVKRIARFFQVSPVELLPDWCIIPSADDDGAATIAAQQHG